MIAEINDDWKKWIFENLIEGHGLESIVSVMVEKGFDLEVAKTEVISTSQSPYLDSAQKYYKKLLKRNKMATVVDMFARMDPDFTKIERIPIPPFQEFIIKYLSKSRPVILQGAINNWKAKDWDFDYLKKTVGNKMIEIQDKRESNKNFEPEKGLHNAPIKFSDFIDRITSVDSSNDAYLTAYNTKQFRESIKSLFDDLGNIGQNGDSYVAADAIKDSCHLWIGPKGTITPLHCDEMNIIFTQIKGSKRYMMYPPSQSAYVYDTNYVYSDVNVLDLDQNLHPEFNKALGIEFVINEGEVLFIPAYWWHHVTSLEPSISVSFTSVNVPNNYNSLVV